MRGEQAEETALGRDMLHLHPAVATGLGATQPINKLNLRCCPVCLLTQGTCTASHREKLLPRTLQGRRLPLESAADPHLLFLQLCVWGGGHCVTSAACWHALHSCRKLPTGGGRVAQAWHLK